MTPPEKRLEPQPVFTNRDERPGAAMLVYALMLTSLLFMVTGIIAVVIAYVYRDEAPAWLQSHYQLQIRTFWISILYLIVGLLTWILFIGQAILLFWLVWFLVRCVKGIRYLNLRRPYPDPQSWWI
ncbi:MAG: hypothetical protein R6X15_03760 [Pseudomonadota bacterium]